MKSFFKTILATVIGVSIALVILFVFFVGSIASGLSTSSSTATKIEDNSVLYIKLQGLLEERKNDSPANQIVALLGNNDNIRVSLHETIEAIEAAQNNDKIKGIFIESGVFGGSPASLQALHRALLHFKEQNKFIFAYADSYTQSGYYLSSLADTVALNPAGSILLNGFSITPTFYTEALKKLGVEMQVFRVGNFKSAVEPYTNTSMSSENRKQLLDYIQSSWNTIAQDIAQGRDLSFEQVQQITDKFPAMMAQDSLIQLKLADTLMYRTQAIEYLKKRLGIEENEALPSVSVEDILAQTNNSSKKSSDNEVAVIYAVGEIFSGSSSLSEGIYDQSLVRTINKIAKDDDIKAVVLRVNSPGGSAFASEQIWQALKTLKEKKTFVVSMSDYAASGGYYISCHANKIFAEASTLTGSIGIFGMFPNVQGLTQKIGLSYDNVKTNQFANFGEITRPMTPSEKQLLQGYVNRGYDLFIKRCAEGRNISEEKIKELAQGRVYSGIQAQELGLVDELGGVEAAIKEAANIADIEDYKVTYYPKETSFWAKLFSTEKDQLIEKISESYLPVELHSLKAIKDLKKRDYIQAIWPYEITQ